jgi:hypothetical protein
VAKQPRQRRDVPVLPDGGTVQFKDGNNTSLGKAAVSYGIARFISTLTPGQHSLIAVFTPADSATLGSVSEPVTLLVTPQETILTESPGTM